MLFGHAAVSALEHRYLKAEFVPVMAAAVVPDAVDKVAHYVFHQAPHGRWWGHTLLGLVITTAVVWLVSDRRAAGSWALGYVSHLVCDMGSVVPWFYPLVTYEFPPSYGFQATMSMTLANVPRMLLELGLSIWAAVALWPACRATVARWVRAPGG